MKAKVFLAWHDKPSQSVAKAFRDWLPQVINMVDPFVSTDITKGEKWGEKLTDELSESKFGIIVVTRQTFNSPWINFEAGAISNKVGGQSFVSPFLFGMESAELKGPLGQYQTTENTKDDILQLVNSINESFGDDDKLGPDILDKAFEKWWPDIEEQLKKISKNYEEAPIPSTSIKWLYTGEDLAEKLKSIGFEQIWIICQNLCIHTLDSKAKDMIEYNIQNDRYYKFFTQTKEAEENAKNVKELFKVKPDNCKIVPIEEDKFKLLSSSDYIVLFNEKGEGLPSHGFFQLPLPSEEKEKYWIEVNNEAAAKLVNRFKEEQEVPKGTT